VIKMNRLSVLLSLVVGTLFFNLPCAYAEGGHGSNMGILLLGVLNFVVFLIVLPFTLKALFQVNIFSHFKEKEKKVSEEVKNSDEIIKSAADSHDSFKKKVEKVSDEISILNEGAVKLGSKFKENLVASSKERAGSAVKEGKMMVERETSEAMTFLKKRLLELTAEKAEQKIKKNLDKKSHDNLISECIKQLEEI